VGLEVDADVDDALTFMGVFSRTVGEIMGRKHAGPAVLETMAELQEDWWATAGGGTWPPLSPRTIEEKERLGFPLDILVRTGRLMAAATENPLRKSRDAYAEFFPEEVYWTLEVEYAPFHQLGGEIIPQRELFDDTPDAHRAIADTVDEWIEENFSGEGKQLMRKLSRRPR
jgi:phage gpG-like protein